MDVCCSYFFSRVQCVYFGKRNAASRWLDKFDYSHGRRASNDITIEGSQRNQTAHRNGYVSAKKSTRVWIQQKSEKKMNSIIIAGNANNEHRIKFLLLTTFAKK